MGYFKNLFPELQDQQVRKPAGPGGAPDYVNKEQYPATPQQVFEGYGPTSESNQQQNAQAAQVRNPVEQEGPNVKAQYQQAQASKMQGWHEALKLSTDVDADISKAKAESEGIVNITPKDEDDLKGVIEKLGKKSERPSRLADDLRVIASRRTVDPFWSQKLLKAATLLDQADKADQYIEGLKKPGQPLAVTKQEAVQGAASLRSQVDAQQTKLQGAGSLRMQEQAPTLQRDLAQAQRYEAFAQGDAGGHVDNTPPDFDSVLTANGWSKGDFLLRVSALQRQLGANMSATIAPGAAGMAIASTLNTLGAPGQMILAQMQRDVASGRQTPGGGTNPNQKPSGKPDMPDPYEARIRDREARFEQAYQELKQLKGFNSMWDVAFYCLFAMMMGPGPAALLFTNKAKRGQLEGELEMLQKEVEGLSRRQDSHRRMEEDARRYAAGREFDERRFQHTQKKDDFYMNLRQQSPAGKDQVLDSLMGGYRMWQDELDEAEKVLSNQFNFSDAQIKAANAKRDRALPMVEKSRQQITRYQAQRLNKAQSGGEVAN